ncbi:uncharacterized protein MYCFIDRAFT_178311 [Pseudocercospora fijiensis CIRAD86]|uniref:Uncharacterized protein n=1 Tax=Pseudocercospora fijiensis (strain CIRAD86) TaxID=383855 RepID=M2YPW5_PSEFD|nr:uncharacterized protein MYCFIDRAFT_178311 [Pseudocercospora fijiensis CIRAD86]EME79750.1 hypothetical protein MYCFIDRAFT_178311 [Pseudocercospora fijiensis CIRAD86]
MWTSTRAQLSWEADFSYADQDISDWISGRIVALAGRAVELKAEAGAGNNFRLHFLSIVMEMEQEVKQNRTSRYRGSTSWTGFSVLKIRATPTHPSCLRLPYPACTIARSLSTTSPSAAALPASPILIHATYGAYIHSCWKVDVVSGTSYCPPAARLLRHLISSRNLTIANNAGASCQPRPLLHFPAIVLLSSPTPPISRIAIVLQTAIDFWESPICQTSPHQPLEERHHHRLTQAQLEQQQPSAPPTSNPDTDIKPSLVEAMLSFAEVKTTFFTVARLVVLLLALANMEISRAKIERMLSTIGFGFVLVCSALASLLVFSLLCALGGIIKAKFDARNDEYYRKIYSPIQARNQEHLRRVKEAVKRRYESKLSAKTVPYPVLEHLPAPPTALDIEQKRREHENWERKHRLVPETPAFIPLRPLFAAPLPVQPLRPLTRPQPTPLPPAIFAPICRASITGTTITFRHLAAPVTVAPLFQQVTTTDLAPTTTMPPPEIRSAAQVSVPSAPEVPSTDLNSTTTTTAPPEMRSATQVSPPAAAPSSSAEPCPRHPNGGEHATKSECAFCASEALFMDSFEK